MSQLVDPFLDNVFMQRALLAGILVSIACAIVGSYVVLRGLAFVGDALAHGVLPGVAGAVIIGAPVMLGAAAGALAMIVGVGFITAKSRLSNDSAIGLLFIGLLALGVVLVSSSDELTGDLDAILFGEFLGVSWSDLAVQAGVIAAMAPDAPTRLKGELGITKRVAWSGPLPLSEVKALAGALGCSVNDVLVSCVAGALRAWLLEAGDALGGEPVRALVPVNLRPPGPVTELGNRFGLVFLDLPVATADPVERVLAVHEGMAALKNSQQPSVALGLLAGMGMAPAFIRERVLEALAANASIVITNVRGPEQARYLAGQRIGRDMFWVPQSGGIGIGTSILSYDGQVNFGVIADQRRVPDPAEIAVRFAAEFETLLLLALMLP